MSDSDSIVDELFPEPAEKDKKRAEKDFFLGGSDFDSGKIQRSPFAQFGNIAYQEQMKKWQTEKVRQKA